MNKERAIERLKQVKDNTVELSTYAEIQEPEDNTIQALQEQIQALDIAIDSLDNEWVDVRDRLPSESGLYICTSANQKKIGTCFYGVGRDKKLQWEDDRQDIIAWKPFPKPYERKEQI